MNLIIAIFGLLIACFCAWGLVAPRRMTDTVLEFWNKPSGMYLAIGIRLVRIVPIEAIVTGVAHPVADVGEPGHLVVPGVRGQDVGGPVAVEVAQYH